MTTTTPDSENEKLDYDGPWAVYVVDIGTVIADANGKLDSRPKTSTVAWAEILGTGTGITNAMTDKSLAPGMSTGTYPNWEWRPPAPNNPSPAVPLAKRIAGSLENKRVVLLAIEAPAWFPYWVGPLPNPPQSFDKTERARFPAEDPIQNSGGRQWWTPTATQCAMRSVGLMQIVLRDLGNTQSYELLSDLRHQVQTGTIYLCEAFATNSAHGNYKPPYGNWQFDNGCPGKTSTKKDEQDALWAASAICAKAFGAVNPVANPPTVANSPAVSTGTAQMLWPLPNSQNTTHSIDSDEDVFSVWQWAVQAAGGQIRLPQPKENANKRTCAVFGRKQ